MDRSKLTIFAFMLSLLHLTFQVNIQIPDKQEICFSKDLKPTEIIKLNYIASGEHESELSAKVTGPYSAVLYHREGVGSGHLEYTIQNEGAYTVCFHCIRSNLVSFEFYTLNETSKVMEIAKGGVFQEIHGNISQISEIFNVMETNLKFSAERKIVHQEVTEYLLDTLKHMTLFKIAIIFIISFIQIFIIRKFFKIRVFEYMNPFSDSKI